MSAERPLSPHLQIYRWHLSMALSIAHRVTGGALTVGLILLTVWLVALASGPEDFAYVNGIVDSWFGGLVLFGYTFAVFLHMCSGLRHMAFDAGYGFDKETSVQTGKLVLGAAVGLTLLTWIIVLAA